jgi:diacylglycerol kinase family enzyme
VARDRSGEGFDAVIGAGGDGTIHEVVGGLAGTGTPLGILPWGTGNVFAREMGLPRRVKALCKVIRHGRRVDIDLGLADGRPFLLMASVGLDAYALGRMKGIRGKRLWGLWAYVFAGLDAWARYPSPGIEVRLGDGRMDKGSFVLVSNTKLYGAYFVLQPAADPTDGLLDVFVFRDTGRWKFLGMIVQLVWHNLVLRSSHAPGFLARHGVYRVDSLRLLPGRERPVQVDGEFLEGGAVSVEVASRALKVLLPRHRRPPL